MSRHAHHGSRSQGSGCSTNRAVTRRPSRAPFRTCRCTNATAGAVRPSFAAHPERTGPNRAARSRARSSVRFVRRCGRSTGRRDQRSARSRVAMVAAVPRSTTDHHHDRTYERPENPACYGETKWGRHSSAGTRRKARQARPRRQVAACANRMKIIALGFFEDRRRGRTMVLRTTDTARRLR